MAHGLYSARSEAAFAAAQWMREISEPAYESDEVCELRAQIDEARAALQRAENALNARGDDGIADAAADIAAAREWLEAV